jgi:hypothetical protein
MARRRTRAPERSSRSHYLLALSLILSSTPRLMSFDYYKLPTTSILSSTPPTQSLRASVTQALRSRCTLRSLLLLLVQALICALTIIGALSIGATTMGRLSIVPSYTAAQIRDAGWSRPALFPLSSPPSSPLSSSHPHLNPLVNPGKLKLHNLSPAPTSLPSSSLHLLILTPLGSSTSHLATYFSILDSLSHPHLNTSLGFLISDSESSSSSPEEGTTDTLLRELEGRTEGYRSVTVLEKNFGLQVVQGEMRHRVWLQGQRRYVPSGLSPLSLLLTDGRMIVLY